MNKTRLGYKVKPLLNLIGTHRIVIEKDDGKLEFEPGGYHFASSVRSTVNTGGSGSMVRARRLAQEVSSLATSLPLSSSSSVFVRCDKERLDVMKVIMNLCQDIHSSVVMTNGRRTRAFRFRSKVT